MPKGEKPQWQAPDRAFAAYGWNPAETDEKRRYLAVITALDDNVGRVLQALNAAGQRENTLVAFISDMGPILRPTHGLGVASAGIYRDGAPSLYEGGVRVPALFRWPGKIAPGSVSKAMLSHLDLLPAFLTTAGATAPKDRILDGRDCLPALANNADTPHERLFFHLRDAVAVREGSLKLIRPKARAGWELYDLAADPSEKHNLATERPQDMQRLAAAITRWQLDMKNDASEPVTYKAAKKVN
jgi:arylsulfatase A-like enzyme